jgi:hypothetical protein
MKQRLSSDVAAIPDAVHARIIADASEFSGIHLFYFGGYLRTCKWLHEVASGQGMLINGGGFGG